MISEVEEGGNKLGERGCDMLGLGYDLHAFPDIELGESEFGLSTVVPLLPFCLPQMEFLDGNTVFDMIERDSGGDALERV